MKTISLIISIFCFLLSLVLSFYTKDLNLIVILFAILAYIFAWRSDPSELYHDYSKLVYTIFASIPSLGRLGILFIFFGLLGWIDSGESLFITSSLWVATTLFYILFIIWFLVIRSRRNYGYMIYS